MKQMIRIRDWRRWDPRFRGAAITLAAILGIGSASLWAPDWRTDLAPATPAEIERSAVPDALSIKTVSETPREEVDRRFQQAALMLHAKEYEHAATALHRVLELDPRMPEAHVNMGYAMLGMERYEIAHDFFQTAIALRPAQANAYFGLALSLEGKHDLEAALGAMRSYIHLTQQGDPYVRKARAALWEWENGIQAKKSQETQVP